MAIVMINYQLIFDSTILNSFIIFSSIRSTQIYSRRSNECIQRWIYQCTAIYCHVEAKL